MFDPAILSGNRPIRYGRENFCEKNRLPVDTDKV